MKASISRRRLKAIAFPSLLAVLLLTLWHFAVVWSRTPVLPSPADVLRGTMELVNKGQLGQYAGDSLRRVMSAYIGAIAVGIPAGLFLGSHPVAAQTVNPVIQMLRPISPIAWIPVAVVLFGVADLAAIYLIFLAAFFPIVTAAMNGVRAVPPMYRRAGRNFGLSRAQLLARVVWPAALPRMLVGLRIALGIAWMVVVAAEMVAANSGLGYLVIDARNSGKRYDRVVAAMVLIGLIGLTLDLIMRRFETIGSVKWGFRDER